MVQCNLSYTQKLKSKINGHMSFLYHTYLCSFWPSLVSTTMISLRHDFGIDVNIYRKVRLFYSTSLTSCIVDRLPLQLKKWSMKPDIRQTDMLMNDKLRCNSTLNTPCNITAIIRGSIPLIINPLTYLFKIFIPKCSDWEMKCFHSTFNFSKYVCDVWMLKV